MEITPEMLKVVAEGMGRGNNNLLRVSFSRCVYGGIYDPTEYNPLTNAEQCMEIMEKLKEVIDYGYDRDFKVWEAVYEEEDVTWFRTGKTINEAVVLAAYEYFKGEG